MPTGYTHGILEGKIKTFPQFAMGCAKAFGACITMWDDPHDAPIPEEFKPNTNYHDEAIVEAKKTLEELQGMSKATSEKRASAAFNDELSERQLQAKKRNDDNQKFRDMRGKVNSWTAPDGYEGFKAFMLNQLDISAHDYRPDPLTALTGDEWRENALAKASRDLDYHEKNRNEEIERVDSRNIWLKTLRASLAQSPQGDE